MFYVDLTICKMLLQFISKRHNKGGTGMANVYDVAKYILQKQGEMTTMKLQKLVYYCQAWSLVWDSQPIFDDRIEAWASGPVVPSLYNIHRGAFEINDLPIGNPSVLTRDGVESINAVLNLYGGKSAQWLSDLTHMEKPWKQARKGKKSGENSQKEINPASMVEYYSSL